MDTATAYKQPRSLSDYSPKVGKKWTSWTDRDGNQRLSFPWNADDDIVRDAVGLDPFEQIWYFGAYAQDTRESAIGMARIRLEQRGFNPDDAETLLVRK